MFVKNSRSKFDKILWVAYKTVKMVYTYYKKKRDKNLSSKKNKNFLADKN